MSDELVAPDVGYSFGEGLEDLEPLGECVFALLAPDKRFFALSLTRVCNHCVHEWTVDRLHSQLTPWLGQQLHTNSVQEHSYGCSEGGEGQEPGLAEDHEEQKVSGHLDHY